MQHFTFLLKVGLYTVGHKNVSLFWSRAPMFSGVARICCEEGHKTKRK